MVKAPVKQNVTQVLDHYLYLSLTVETPLSASLYLLSWSL